MELYTNKHLQYPLSIEEYKVINKVWRFINIFITNQENKSIIHLVRKKYTLDEFYILEYITNKLFWNLRHKLYSLYFKDKTIDLSNFSCNIINSKIDNNILNNYEFGINKHIIFDKKNKKTIQISNNDNFFNNLTSFITTDRGLYEKIMSDPLKSKSIKPIKSIYTNYNYSFPNINYCYYQFGTLEQHLDRIKKMYFYKENDITYYWKNFIDKNSLTDSISSNLTKSISSNFIESNSFDHSNENTSEYTNEYNSEYTSESLEGGAKKWNTFCHNGVLFPDEYKQHNIPILYDGKEIILDSKSEEAATLYAKYTNTDYMKNNTFKKNFWKDWKTMLDKSYNITSLDKCDFSLIYEHILKEKEKVKNITKEEKQIIKEAKDKIEEKYKKAIVDGVEQPVGNFRVEPPGIFIGRGCHPKLGRIKKRIYPNDMVINIGKECPIPIPNNSKYKWGDIIHDKSVEWLASWKDTITGKIKYVWLGSHSKFKAISDQSKFDFARKLKRKIKGIRKKYEEDMKNNNIVTKQLATALYFIDTLALRIGNEKGSGEADTVGVTSLRVEHIKIGDKNEITLDFLGKDSIRYVKTFTVSNIVYKNLQDFEKNKNKNQDLFDKINATTLNKYIQHFMKGLTAKVFRTFNASLLMQKELNKATNKIKNNNDTNSMELLLEALNKANIKVALLCNHRKKVSKSFDQQIDKLNEKVKDLQKKKKKLKKIVKNKIKIDKLNNQINRIKALKLLKIELKDLSLETSKANYIDPRIIVAYTKRHDISINKVFSKQLENKFNWSLDVEPEFKF